MNDRFHYDALVDDALRSVVRRVLRQVADKGLPGSHHFYISFRSNDPGVELPEYLRAKYPEEMTIVLQHQYWDLVLTEEFFEVTVSFNKQQERIKVPYRGAVGLRRSIGPLRPAVRPQGQGRCGARQGRRPPRRRRRRCRRRTSARRSARPRPARPRPRLAPSPPRATPKPEDPASKIVKLDSFRKK